MDRFPRSAPIARPIASLSATLNTRRLASLAARPADFLSGGVRTAVAVLVVLCAALVVSAAAASAASGDVGYRDGLTSGGGKVTGTKRAESALWINNGFWWANMWDPVSNEFHIFRLNTGTQSWSDTGVRIDDRSSTSADTLWDGGHLYVASHRQSETPASGYPSYLFRFSFNPVSNGYALDSGFPVQINNFKTETLTIAKDSTGKLWATWMQGSKIYVNRTLGDDKSWGTPFALPVSGTGVSSDDISAVVAFGGDKVGVMWGNQNSSQDGFYFAIHDDGQADTTWQPSVLAWGGSGVADDHINLKADSSGRLYAAVKTSFTRASQPLTALLVRSPTGAWTRATVDTVADCPNRPTVVIDEAGLAHIFETGPSAPTFACSNPGGDVYEKTAPLSTLEFPPGRGTAILRDDANHEMHNNTSTKQTVSGATGLVTLAVEEASEFYWHHWDPVTPASASSPQQTVGLPVTPTPPSATIGVSQLSAMTATLIKALRTRGIAALTSTTETLNVPGPGTLQQRVYSPRPPRSATRSKIKSVRIASGSHSFGAAGTGTLRLKLTVAGRRAIRRHKSLKVAIATRFTPAGGQPVVFVKRLTVKTKHTKPRRRHGPPHRPPRVD